MSAPSHQIALGLTCLALVAGTGCDGGPSSPRCPGGSDCGPGDAAAGDVDRTKDISGDDPWGDRDDDRALNFEDNCPETTNPEQADGDDDGVGDPCDNCPSVANTDQTPADEGDGGAACDEPGETYDPDRDSDGDSTPDADDTCPNTKNPGQSDSDGDGVGDSCDNCPSTANPAQGEPSDGEGGIACSRRPAGTICKRIQSDTERFRPNLYFLLDKSGSMQGNKMDQARRALVELARKLQNRARFGVTAFSSDCNPPEQLEVGQHNAASVQQSISRITPSGKTGTGGALGAVRREQRFRRNDDERAKRRSKAVVVITDGDANRCGGLAKARTEARKLNDQFGVKVFVVGFRSDARPANLTKIARAGGTNKHRTAGSTNQLVRKLSAIFSRTVPCTYRLEPPPEGIDPNRIWVKIDDGFVDPSGYSYDPGSKKLTLGSQACRRLRTASEGPLDAPFEIVLGCPPACGDESCNYRDDDCDGETDETCGKCSGEVCNGSDDDCDDETDEGCPSCSLYGDSCEDDASCCHGVCTRGTCSPPCRPIGVTCEEDRQCCSGTCAPGTGGDRGACAGK
ncbi:MAG: VWA domain-containing protein [Bradymonadaceae bacterium]